MTDIETTTIEIDAPAFLDDPKVLAYLAGTDADLDRLVLEDDGKLWAYSKRAPESLCRAPLVDIVALAFPKYAEPASVPQEAPVSFAESASPVAAPSAPPKAPKPPRSRTGSETSIAKTGEARGLLADFKAGKTGMPPPRIFIDGTLKRCPAPAVDGSMARVAVAEDRKFKGYAVLDRLAFETLRKSPHRPDSYLFNLVDGVATTRVRRSFSDPYVQPVDALLSELGSPARVRLELTA